MLGGAASHGADARPPARVLPHPRDTLKAAKPATPPPSFSLTLRLPPSLPPSLTCPSLADATRRCPSPNRLRWL